jgi:hypothetical protein
MASTHFISWRPGVKHQLPNDKNTPTVIVNIPSSFSSFAFYTLFLYIRSEVDRDMHHGLLANHETWCWQWFMHLTLSKKKVLAWFDGDLISCAWNMVVYFTTNCTILTIMLRPKINWYFDWSLRDLSFFIVLTLLKENKLVTYFPGSYWQLYYLWGGILEMEMGYWKGSFSFFQKEFWLLFGRVKDFHTDPSLITPCFFREMLC